MKRAQITFQRHISIVWVTVGPQTRCFWMLLGLTHTPWLEVMDYISTTLFAWIMLFEAFITQYHQNSLTEFAEMYLGQGVVREL